MSVSLESPLEAAYAAAEPLHQAAWEAMGVALAAKQAAALAQGLGAAAEAEAAYEEAVAVAAHEAAEAAYDVAWAEVLRLEADEPEVDPWEGAVFCSICDGLGHGQPGYGPCPVEEPFGAWGYDEGEPF